MRPPPLIHCDEHAEVLAHWWALRHEGTLAGSFDVLYLDAHLDLQFVHPQRIAALQACTTPQQVRALAKRHPLMPDAGTAYGIEDFLYPASQLGLIRRVIWIAPPHVDIDQPQRAMAWLRQMQGVTPEALDAFHRRTDGWLAGELLGVPLLIGRLAMLPTLPLRDPPCPVVWDIDVDYCIALPGDGLWITPEALCAALQSAPCRPVAIGISDSIGTGFTPQACAPLGEAIARGLSQAAGHMRDERRPREPDADLLRQLTEIRARKLPLDLGRLLWLTRRVEQMPMASPLAALAWAALGLLHAAARQTDRALHCAGRHAMLAGQAHAGLAMDIGRLLLAQGRAHDAIVHFQAGLHEDETRVTAHVYLAQALAACGQPRQACSLFDQAIEMSPAWTELRDWRARLG